MRVLWMIAVMVSAVLVGSVGMDDEWLSTKGASALLGVKVRQLYRLIDEGRVPAYKFGRVIRLRRHEVLKSGRRLRDDEA